MLFWTNILYILIYRIFLEEPNLEIINNSSEANFTNLQGRSRIVDLVCNLQSGVTVNVEVEKYYEDHFRMVRYHSSRLSTNLTDTGRDFKDI